MCFRAQPDERAGNLKSECGYRKTSSEILPSDARGPVTLRGNRAVAAPDWPIARILEAYLPDQATKDEYEFVYKLC